MTKYRFPGVVAASVALTGATAVASFAAGLSLRDPGIAVFGFGQDHRGHIYVLGNTTGVLDGNTGVVLKVKAPRRHR